MTPPHRDRSSEMLHKIGIHEYRAGRLAEAVALLTAALNGFDARRARLVGSRGPSMRPRGASTEPWLLLPSPVDQAYDVDALNNRGCIGRAQPLGDALASF